MFRAELKDVDIITFDELFDKFLLRLLKEPKTHTNSGTSGSPERPKYHFVQEESSSAKQTGQMGTQHVALQVTQRRAVCVS